MNKSTILKYLGVASLVLNLNASDFYTVDDLILKSLENSPNLQVSKLSYEASKNRYDASFSAYLPNVNLSLSAGKIGQNNVFSNGDMIDDTLILGTLSAEQIIYDFGKTGGSVDSNKFDSDSYLMQNIQDISDKKLRVKEAYYNVLSAMAIIDVQKENVKLNQAQLYRSQKYFTAGIRTKIDVSDAKVTLIQAKLDLKRAQYDLKLSYANLDEVVGFKELEQTYTVYNRELQLDSLYSSLGVYEKNLQEAILFAYENRAILKKQKSQIESKVAQSEEVISEYYPALYASANYTKQSVDTFQSFLPQNQWQALVNLDWNIYQGGFTDARAQEKRVNINIENATLLENKLKIKKETTKAFINLHKSKDSVELSQSLVEVSSEKFNQASKRYEHGLSDYIELQQARQGYIDAKANLIIDYYSYYISVAYLDNAIGK